MSHTPPRVLAFDVFGTVADWHTSVAQDIAQRIPGIDGAAFARDWRAGYKPAMARVASGELGWTRIDDLHRMILNDLLPRYDLADMPEAERRDLNRVWHRLAVWPDVARGLARLRSRFICTTLSNGNIGLLTKQARHAGIQWDCVLSAEVFGKYKPDPATYLGVADIFDVPAHQVMMVAAHQSDLDSAAALGLQTAYIERVNEFGADQPKDVSGNQANSFHAVGFNDLADQLGCTR